MSLAFSVARRDGLVPVVLRIVLGALLLMPLLPGPIVLGAGEVPDHLVVSEVVTGGAGASDELIELHNPTAAPLPLEGLEVVYASSTGATVSRRASWDLGAPSVPARGHVLIAHQDGIFAPIADATYATGIAAAGGSVAIRIIGASSSIDAVGWGTAAGALPEGMPAPAPATGGGIERLPGGEAGSTQDTGDNAADFVLRDTPGPQNLGSPPTPAGPGGPGATPSPTPSSTPMSTQLPMPTLPPAATPTPTPTPANEPIDTIAAARAMADGAPATIEGVALTGSDFHDGGGFVADVTGGIAVLVTDGAFTRGSRLRISGELDDRFSQRTLRADPAAVVSLGTGQDPLPFASTTGGVNEMLEGSLLAITGSIVGSATELTTGLAYDLDDGSGAVRVLVGTGTGIDTSSWSVGATIALVGVAGQRDSTGSGTTGYRVMPRDAADVLSFAPPSSATPAPSSVESVSPTASPAPAGVSTIAAARAVPKNTRLTVRGVVTLASGVVDKQTAVIQDATGAIVLRLGGSVGALPLGAQLEVTGARSTKSGMETIRVTDPPRRLGSAEAPAPRAMRTGDAAEAHEARLVVVSGALGASARRAASGSVSFDFDDGSGPLKVVIGAGLAADATALVEGTWVEVRGVLGQETTGAQPLSGYRVWPGSAAEVRVVAGVAPAAGGGNGSTAATTLPADLGELGELGDAGRDGLRIGAALVAGPWTELGVGGILWDGSRLVAVDTRSSDLVTALLGGRRPPVAVELAGLRAVGTEPITGIPLVALDPAPGQSIPGTGPVPAPRASLGATAAWATLVGRLTGHGSDRLSLSGGRSVEVDLRCASQPTPAKGAVSVTGIAIGEARRLIVPCHGMRPAPVLARHAPEGTTRGEASTATRMDAIDPESAPLRPITGGLLLVAALGMAGSAAVLRWRHRPDDGRAASEGATEAGTELHDDESSPPRLTLVSVPREHGP